MPDALEDLRVNEPDFEVITGKITQSVRLMYRPNKVTKSTAVIFVQTDCKEVAYPDAILKGEIAHKLWSEGFDFQECDVCNNLTKKEVVEKLEKVQKQAEKYEKSNKKETFAVAIVWIGFSLRPDVYDEHKKVLDLLTLTPPSNGTDGTTYVKQYALTHLGEAINLTEYATRIAGVGPSTYVIHMEDWINENVPLVQRNVFVSNESGFDDLILGVRPGRKRHTLISNTDVAFLSEWLTNLR